MSNLNLTTNPLFSQALIESDLEKINTAITLWFIQHPQCSDEIAEYRTAQAYLDVVAGDDDDAYTHLLVTLACDFYRSLTGRNWTVQS